MNALINQLEGSVADLAVHPLRRRHGTPFAERYFDVVIERLDVDPGEIKDFASILADAELQRSERFVFDRDRNRFIVGRARLRWLLSGRLGVSPEMIELTYGVHGKPILGPRYAESGLRFNVSHSEDIIAYAFATDREIGIDIEAVKLIPDVDVIATQFFSKLERETYNSLDSKDKTAGFFNCWTRKEAFIKALGEGLYFPLDRFDVSLVPGEPAVMRRFDNRPGEICGWTVHSFIPAMGFVGAVVVQSNGSDMAPRMMRGSDSG